jgi:hypothetical protein
MFFGEENLLSLQFGILACGMNGTLASEKSAGGVQRKLCGIFDQDCTGIQSFATSKNRPVPKNSNITMAPLLT